MCFFRWLHPTKTFADLKVHFIWVRSIKHWAKFTLSNKKFFFQILILKTCCRFVTANGNIIWYGLHRVVLTNKKKIENIIQALNASQTLRRKFRTKNKHDEKWMSMNNFEACGHSVPCVYYRCLPDPNRYIFSWLLMSDYTRPISCCITW